jgi:tetratricopeptide (TPR) repeat protein
MADKSKKTDDSSDPKQIPDNELFSEKVQEELSLQDVFAGHEDFFRQLSDSFEQGQVNTGKVRSSSPTLQQTSSRFLSPTQIILCVGIFIVTAVLMYALYNSRIPAYPNASTTSPSEVNEQATPITQHQVVKQIQIQSPNPKTAISSTQPVSLKVAQDLYQQKDYEMASAVYDQIQQSIPQNADSQLLLDFLQLKRALCVMETQNLEESDRLLRIASQSQSPIVRIIANYNRSLLDMENKRYLDARIRAYQTLALIDAIDFDKVWSLMMKRDCYFIAAASITLNTLSLCDADKDVPKIWWSTSDIKDDPFTNLNTARSRAFPQQTLEEQLDSLLNAGINQLSKGLIGPQIERIGQETNATIPTRWFVISKGASIEELLARFAANAGLDIYWESDEGQNANELRNIFRQRPTNLYMTLTPTQDFITVAAGSVGLLASQNENKIVKVVNPANYQSLSEHVSLLCNEAVSLWQRFLLSYHDDDRIPNVHFALALLQAQKRLISESVAEYKMVANRFTSSPLAPYALLRSSRLKSDINDYAGARQDLNQLVEQYPDAKIVDDAYLALAGYTARANLKDEAARLFKKVYNLSFSAESRTLAAMGAGKSFYEVQDYPSAQQWLIRYINLAKEPVQKDLYKAYYLLGKTNLALGKTPEACNAFRASLMGQLSKEEYVETISALVQGYLEQNKFFEALDTLEEIHPWRFSQSESIKLLLLKSNVYRAMGLIDKAVALLDNKVEYISDQGLKTKISLEIAKCYIAQEDYETAHKKLAEILVLSDSGAQAHDIALTLANVCLKLGQINQSISICQQLLNIDLPDNTKERTLETLVAAYDKQKKYDHAILAIMGQW